MADSVSISVDLSGRHAGVRSDALEARFEDVYRATWERVYSFVRWQMPDAATAQELVGLTYFKAYLHRHVLPELDSPQIWILRIAHNAVVDYYRAEGRRQAVVIPIDEVGDLRTHSKDPEAAYASKERLAILIKVINELDDRERTLIALKFAAQRTNREMAEILHVSEAAISMRLLRALRGLRRRLQELGL